MGTHIDYDYELRECKNHQCGRKSVGIYTNAKFCKACGSRLRNVRFNNNSSPKIEEATPEQLVKGKVQVVDKRRVSNHGPTPPHDTFTCSGGDVEGCPIANNTTPKVTMPHRMFQQWVFMALKFKTEWFAYLKGTESEEGWTITDVYFPKQECNGGHAEVIDLDKGGDPIQEGTVGAVHSHVAMSACFSAEDKQHANWPVEIVVNNKGDFELSVRMELECGRTQRVKGQLLLSSDEETKVLCEQLEAKLVENKPAGFFIGWNGHV